MDRCRAQSRHGADQVFTIPPLFPPGDTSGDGIVSQSELDAVLTNYWPYSPWLLITNTAGLGTTNVQFALPAPTAWNFTVEVSTNLSNWTPLGPAYPITSSATPPRPTPRNGITDCGIRDNTTRDAV